MYCVESTTIVIVRTVVDFYSWWGMNIRERIIYLKEQTGIPYAVIRRFANVSRVPFENCIYNGRELPYHDHIKLGIVTKTMIELLNKVDDIDSGKH